MPLPVDVDVTWLNPPDIDLDAGELRRADAAFLAGAGGVAFGGVARHSDTSLAVTVDGSDQVTIQPGSVVVPGDAVTGTGAYRGSLAAAASGNLTARNATNGRIDLVVFRVLDTDVVGSHGAYKGRVEVITGTPSATPPVPARPSMAVELARITVPPTSGGAATVDGSWRTYACAAGGELLVPTAARFPAHAAKWQTGRALDTGTEWIYNGTAWSPSVQHFVGGMTSNANGDIVWLLPSPFASELRGVSIIDHSDPAQVGALILKLISDPTLTNNNRLTFRLYDVNGNPVPNLTTVYRVTAWGR